MTEEDKILNKELSVRKWYAPMGLTRQYADRLKQEFLAGRMTYTKKCDILHSLGYRAKWTKQHPINVVLDNLDLDLPDNSNIRKLERRGVNRNQARRIVRQAKRKENKNEKS